MSPFHALRTPRGRRHFVAPATAVLAVPVLLLAGALPAWAQNGNAYGSPYGSAAEAAGTVLRSPLTVTLGIVALVGSAVVAGTAALGLLSPPSRRSVLVVRTGATVAVPAPVINWLVGGLPAVAAFPQAAGVLATALLFARGCRIASAVAGVLLVGALGYNATIGHSGWHVGLAAVHMVTAVTWLGSAVSVATPACGARSTVLRRHTLVFAGAATLAVAAAVLEAVAEGLRFDGVSAASLTGQLLLFQGLGLVVAVSTGLCRPGAIGGRVVGIAAGLVFTAGTVIAVLTPAPVPAETGRPLLRTVALAGRDVPVVVVPQRPGRNLVHVGVPGVLVGGVPAEERVGAPGGWAVVDLPAGTDVLTVEADRNQVPLRLDLGPDPAPPALVAGLSGPDGPECLSAVVGGMIRGVTDLPAACPADALSAQDAVALRATVRFLADRDVALHLVADGSGRSKAAAAVVRDAAAAHGLTPVDRPDREDAVVVVAGWEGGGRRLTEELSGRSTVGGTYTAPWLATGSVLGARTGAVTTLNFDPRAVPAQRYLADLRAAGAPALASPAGFREWSAPTDRRESVAAPRIFTAAQVAVMPARIGGTDHRTTTPWLPGGVLTPVTPPLLH